MGCGGVLSHEYVWVHPECEKAHIRHKASVHVWWCTSYGHNRLNPLKERCDPNVARLLRDMIRRGVTFCTSCGAKGITDRDERCTECNGAGEVEGTWRV